MSKIVAGNYNEGSFWRDHDQPATIGFKTVDELWLEAKTEAMKFDIRPESISNYYESLTFLGYGTFGAVFRGSRNEKQYAVKMFFKREDDYIAAQQELRVMLYLKKIAQQECAKRSSSTSISECCPANLICYSDHFIARADTEFIELLRKNIVGLFVDPLFYFHFIESDYLSGDTMYDLIKLGVETSIKQLRIEKPNMLKTATHEKIRHETSLMYVKLHLSNEQNLSLLHTALTALAFMHHNGVFHRDIHTNNIMVLNRETFRPESVILDVGLGCVKTECIELLGPGAEGVTRLKSEARILAAAFDFEESREPKHVKKAQRYLETAGILRNGRRVSTMSEGLLSQHISAAIDVYALGSVFYHWMSARIPTWASDEEPRKRPASASSTSDEIWTLIEDMMQIEIPRRVTASEAKTRAFDMLTKATSQRIKKRRDDDDEQPEAQKKKQRPRNED